MARLGDGGELLKCSFCGKSQKQVKKLIAGPGVYICDECIDLCNEIIEEEFSATEEITFTELPVKGEELKETQRKLRAIPGLVAQAKTNLTEVAADYADLAIFNLRNPDGVEHGYPAVDGLREPLPVPRLRARVDGLLRPDGHRWVRERPAGRPEHAGWRGGRRWRRRRRACVRLRPGYGEGRSEELRRVRARVSS